ncbi:MAG: M23 family metallopeptidase [Candidatus Aureabacteria bacterium]|nr:M23 family metallopeptidase [Candidatus Auribacterota bacterium]
MSFILFFFAFSLSRVSLPAPSVLDRVWSFDWRVRTPAEAERDVKGFRIEVLPVPEAAIRRPEGEFGAERRSGISYHKGIDFIEPADTPVCAIADGFICYNELNGGLDSGYGYTVLIDHGNNFYTLYAHLKKESHLPIGTWIKAGQRIARVGRSGNAIRVPKEFQYQLHFEIIHAPSGLVNLGGLKITLMLSPHSLTTLREIGEAVYGPFWGGVLNPEEFVKP